MKNSVLRSKVAEIFSEANRVNNRTQFGMKRFYPISTQKGNKLVEYGMYDYATKKYVLFDSHTTNPEKSIKELEDFISK